MGLRRVHRRDEGRMFYQNLCSPLGMRAESEERSQQTVYQSARHKTVHLEGKKEMGRCAVSLPTSLAGLAGRLPGKRK